MPLITSTALISSLSIAHLTVAYYLLTAPTKVAHHSFVVLMSASMGFPPSPSSLPFTSPALPLAASLLGLLSISDLTAAALPTEIYSYYFASQAPVRILFFFALEGWIYASKPGGALYGAATGAGEEGGSVGTGLVFTWGFVELVSWFWIYVTLRDERREMLIKVQEKRAREEERARG
ncbi:hypothetical protein MMC11_008261 [Xylographa trunciseda]|nr:hypothetical protein [Xylographa trunciseda]